MSSSGPSAAKLQLKKAKEELDAGDADAALALCKKVLAADRSNYNAYILVGVACARKADLQRAVQAYDRAVALKPTAPVAHKGLIDALRSVSAVSADAALPLRRARAQVALAPLSPAHARAARAGAAETLYTLAVRDAELVPEAIAAWRTLREDSAGEGLGKDAEAGALPHGATRVESVVAVLAAIGAGCSRAEENAEADAATSLDDSGSARDPSLFEGGDLGDALDFLEGLQAPLGPHETDARAQELVVYRIGARVRSGKISFEEAGRLLQGLKENEAYLVLAEEDSAVQSLPGAGQVCVQFSDLLDRASSVLESGVSSRDAPRATAIKAASLLDASALKSLQEAADLVDAASEHTRAIAAKRLRASGKLAGPGSTNASTSIAASLSTPTECLVRGRIHLMAGENKQCTAAAHRGLLLCTALGYRDRMKAILHVLKAHALMADRQCHLADAELAQVLAWTEKNGGAADASTLFVQRAVVRGRIRSAEMKSFPDQRGFTSSLADILTVASKSTCPEMVAIAKVEKVWTDALEGSLAQDEMEGLVSELVSLEKQEKESQESKSCSSSFRPWELTVLGDVVVGTLCGTVALAIMRLAQMILLKSEGSDSSLLQRAQNLLMQSAGFMGSRPGPFALLGWIFEMKAFSEGTAVEVRTKLTARAMRCYRKSCNIDPAHILASRRLCRLLGGGSKNTDELVKVAEAVTEKNSRSRWAWNVLGWARFERGLVAEAALAFQNSLKGESSNSRSTRSARFGTKLGPNTPSSRDLDSLVDADSWRGLASAYKLQGKLASAASCLDAAIDVFTNAASSDSSQSSEDQSREVKAVFEVEKADLLTSLEKASEAMELLHPSLLPSGSAETPIGLSTVQFAAAQSAAHACLVEADERWSEGWFHQATALRRQAASHLSVSIEKGLTNVAGVSPSVVYKFLGDALYAAASTRPCKLAAILPKADIARDLAASRTAYKHAIDHNASGAPTIGTVDLAVNLAKQAELEQDGDMAREAIQLLSSAPRCSSDYRSQLAKALHILGDIESNQDFCNTARQLLVQSFQNERSELKRLASALDLVEMSAARGDTDMTRKYALLALRIDATDWRAWFATGLARETDGNGTGWTATKMQSTIDAYAEAERLGGGGPVVAEKISLGLARQVASLVQSRSAGADDAMSIAGIGNLAAASLAAAVRGGASPSETCLAATREAAQDYVERVLAREDTSREEKLHEIPYHADRINKEDVA